MCGKGEQAFRAAFASCTSFNNIPEFGSPPLQLVIFAGRLRSRRSTTEAKSSRPMRSARNALKTPIPPVLGLVFYPAVFKEVKIVCSSMSTALPMPPVSLSLYGFTVAVMAWEMVNKT